MNSIEYLLASKRTDLDDYGVVLKRLDNLQTLQMLHAVLGVGTESGELQDAVKKYLMYGKPIDRVNIIEEAGDLMWYLAILGRVLQFSFEEAMVINIAKLHRRYPEKFTEQEALNRNLKEERKILEGSNEEALGDLHINPD